MADENVIEMTIERGGENPTIEMDATAAGQAAAAESAAQAAESAAQAAESVAEALQYKNEAEAAAESAAAAYGTDLLAPDFNPATANDPGTYVIYSGGIYLLPNGHTAGVAWNNTIHTQVTVGGEVSALNSAINVMEDTVDAIHEVPAGGTSGQILTKVSGSDYDVQWSPVGMPSDAQVDEAVSDWLDDHPEATTTVEDGSITKVKLTSSLAEEIEGKAPGIYGDTTAVAYANIVNDEKQVKIYGNTFEHETVKLYNKEQLDVNNFNNGTSYSIAYSNNDGLLKFNGTSSNKIATMWVMGSSKNVSIPTGLRGKNVTFRAVSDKPCSVTDYGNDSPFRIQIYLRKEGTTGDGRQVDAARIGVVNNTYIDATVSFNVNSDDDTLYVAFRYIGSGSSFDNVNFKFMVYDSSTIITDTDETITDGDSELYDVPTGYTIVSTGCHKNSLYGIVDTKEYVDNHVPSDVVTMPQLQSYIPTVENLGYVTPEMYDAKGDNSTDDSTAIQSALNYAVANGIPFRAFGTYRINTGLVYAGNSGNVYIHKIDYRGTGGAAFTLRGRYNKIYIDEIYAYFSTGGAGFKLETTATTHADHNDITVQTLYANGNAVEFLNQYGSSNGSHLYYNKFNTSLLHSTTANCIYLNGYQHFAENSFWGKAVSNQNGYFVYCENAGNNGTNKFYEFCIENASKNGVYGIVTLIRCRTTECMGRKTPSNNEGNIFTFVNVLPGGRATNTEVRYSAVDVSAAQTLSDRIDIAKTRYESGESAALSLDAAFPKQGSYGIGHGQSLTTYLGSSYDDSDYTPSGTVFAYYNHKGFIPDNDWYYSVTDSSYYTYTTDKSIPTIFDIKTNCTIYLDDSYCAIGINKIKIIQTASEKAVVYDHNNVKIFDGSNLSDGVYVLNCELLPHDPIIIETTRGNLTCSSTRLRGMYLGDNEAWTVEKLNIVS